MGKWEVLKPPSNIAGRCEVPLHHVKPNGSPHSSVLTWLTASSLRLSTNRRLTLKIKTKHHQHFLTYYTSCPDTDTAAEASFTKSQSQSAPSIWKNSRALHEQQEEEQADLIDILPKVSLECMSGFNMLRAKAYSNIYWHMERSTWSGRIWKVTPVK